MSTEPLSLRDWRHWWAILFASVASACMAGLAGQLISTVAQGDPGPALFKPIAIVGAVYVLLFGWWIGARMLQDRRFQAWRLMRAGALVGLLPTCVVSLFVNAPAFANAWIWAALAMFAACGAAGGLGFYFGYRAGAWTLRLPQP